MWKRSYNHFDWLLQSTFIQDKPRVFHSFEELIKALYDPTEPLFYLNLCQNVKVHDFNPPSHCEAKANQSHVIKDDCHGPAGLAMTSNLTISLASHLSKAFVATLKEKIFKVTGEMWIIDVKEEVEDAHSGLSLEEKRQQVNDNVHKRFLALATVKQLLEKFPQAQVKVEA